MIKWILILLLMLRISKCKNISRAHLEILKYGSLYFQNELKNIGKNENNIKTLNLKHVYIQHFEVIIK